MGTRQNWHLGRSANITVVLENETKDHGTIVLGLGSVLGKVSMWCFLLPGQETRSILAWLSSYVYMYIT